MANPQTQAKTIAAALLHEARAAGWVRAQVEIKPDGCVTIATGMVDHESDDDFLSPILRMGSK